MSQQDIRRGSDSLKHTMAMNAERNMVSPYCPSQHGAHGVGGLLSLTGPLGFAGYNAANIGIDAAREVNDLKALGRFSKHPMIETALASNKGRGFQANYTAPKYTETTLHQEQNYPQHIRELELEPLKRRLAARPALSVLHPRDPREQVPLGEESKYMPTGYNLARSQYANSPNADVRQQLERHWDTQLSEEDKYRRALQAQKDYAAARASELTPGDLSMVSEYQSPSERMRAHRAACGSSPTHQSPLLSKFNQWSQGVVDSVADFYGDYYLGGSDVMRDPQTGMYYRVHRDSGRMTPIGRRQ